MNIQNISWNGYNNLIVVSLYNRAAIQLFDEGVHHSEKDQGEASNRAPRSGCVQWVDIQDQEYVDVGHFRGA